jgi:hypothetical protein
MMFELLFDAMKFRHSNHRIGAHTCVNHTLGGIRFTNTTYRSMGKEKVDFCLRTITGRSYFDGPAWLAIVSARSKESPQQNTPTQFRS